MHRIKILTVAVTGLIALNTSVAYAGPATMDGSDVLSRLKGDRQFKNTPVVFLTSTVKPAAPGETNRKICGFPFLSKPVGAEELIACVEENLP